MTPVGDLDAVVWRDPEGLEHPLHDPRAGYSHAAGYYTVVTGREGFGVAPVETPSITVPGLPGAIPKATRTLVRDLDLNLYVEAPGVAELRGRLRELAARIPPGRDGVLRVEAGGQLREITCRYQGGLERTDNADTGQRRHRLVLTLRAHDPYWYGPEEMPVDLTAGPSTGFFPILPLRLAQGADGLTTIHNDGQISAWPVWTITGPAAAVTLTNHTIGRALSVPAAGLAEGDTLIIDTRPGAKTATRTTADGTVSNVYDLLTPTSSLWPLPPGANQVDVALTGAAAATRVTLAYRPRYLTC